MSSAATTRRSPRWLKPANRIAKLLIRKEVAPGGHHILLVPGRRSGVLRGTPVSVMHLAGQDYVVAGFANSDWVRNARKAGWGFVARGECRRRVVLTELPPGERPPLLRQFAREVRGARGFLAVAPDGTDEEYARAAEQHPVFRLDDEAAGAPGAETAP